VTVETALRRACRRLAEAGIADAERDAERLLRHVLGWDRAALLTRGREPLDADAAARLAELVERRGQRRPLQYLLGSQAFWRHEFRVTPDVLIPRPETELLVEACLERLPREGRPLVVDVGTGSGCIALCLAAERPGAEVHAVDVSEAALAVARDNARRLGLEGRVRFHRGHLLEPLAALAGRVELLASNPPYVAAEELPGLQPEVRDHEPRLALTFGSDRFGAYRELAPAAAALLRPGGALVLEIGVGMEAEVRRLCAQAGLEVLEVRPDLQSIPRTVVARRLPGAPASS